MRASRSAHLTPRTSRLPASTHSLPRPSVNDFRCKFAVAAADPDLARLRAWPGFAALAPQLAGFSSAAGAQLALPTAGSAPLRAEAKAPFRLLRLFGLGAFGLGSAVAGVITLPQLLSAASSAQAGLDGGAEKLASAGGNLAVDAGVLALSLVLLRRELDAKALAEAAAEAELQISQLRLVQPSPSNSAPATPTDVASLPLASLRGRLRPLLLVGSAPHLRGCARGAEPLKREIVRRGMLVCALCDDADGGLAPVAKRGFGAASEVERKAERAAGGGGEAFSPNEEGKRWKAQLWDVPAWRDWAKAVRDARGWGEREPFFCSLDADGCVTLCAQGAPDWCVLLNGALRIGG